MDARYSFTRTYPVEVPAAPVMLVGDLGLPPEPRGIVVFAHGSGSSRHSRRNLLVADHLRRAHLATLLFDLLTPEEESLDLRTRELRFDIPRLAERLIHTVDWVKRQDEARDLSVGLFGASTGAAAALIAAAERPEAVRAVVSRGGRPDLADGALGRVRAATLLIVGENDRPVIPLNREALDRIPGEKGLIVVPGATHLFEEPGKLAEVSEHARQWFVRHLVGTVQGAAR